MLQILLASKLPSLLEGTMKEDIFLFFVFQHSLVLKMGVCSLESAHQMMAKNRFAERRRQSIAHS